MTESHPTAAIRVAAVVQDERAQNRAAIRARAAARDAPMQREDNDDLEGYDHTVAESFPASDPPGNY